MKYVNRVITQAKSADPAQRQLPGLEPMQLLITSEGAAILAEQLNYEKYRGEVARLERRINSYNYKRRKPEYLEQDKRQLAEMKRFDPRFAKYSETSPDLTLVEANSSNPANRRNADGSAERNKVMAHVKRRPLQDVMEDESVKVLQRCPKKWVTVLRVFLTGVLFSNPVLRCFLGGACCSLFESSTAPAHN